MKGKFDEVMKRLAAGLMIAIMSILMVNRALYVHIHVLPDGSVVSHAHPFSKNTDTSNGKTHQHTSLEFFLLDQLEVLTLGISAIIVLKVLTNSINFHLRTPDRLLPSLVPFSPGRAPPACI